MVIAGLIVLLVLIVVAGMYLKTTSGKKAQRGAASQVDPAKDIEKPGAVQAQQDEQAEPPTVEIPQDKQQLTGVKVVEVALRSLQKTIRAAGKIEYDERRLSAVNTKVDGWIEKLHVGFTGKHVKKGDPLAEIYSPELMATQKEFLVALKCGKKAGADEQKSDIDKMLAQDAEAVVEAARQRLGLWDISAGQIRTIEETGTPLRSLTIYSPVSGYVVQKTALQGMRVMAGEKLFEVADLSNLWIMTEVYEHELPLIKPGQRTIVRLSSLPGRELTSQIEYIDPVLSGETRTARVRLSVANAGGNLKPGMFTDVEIRVDLGKRLAVPDEAVIDTGRRQIVYVDKGEGYYEPREITTGLRADGLTEVLKGLKAGEKVATSASFLIDAEARLKGVVK